MPFKKYFNFSFHLCFYIAGMYMFSSCRVKKVVTDSVPDQAKAPQVVLNEALSVAAAADTAAISFKYLSARLTAEVKRPNGEKNSVQVSWRCHSDSALWVSISMLGIEGVRLLLTPDSVKAIDRVHAKYYRGNYAWLEEQVHFPLNYQHVQSLLFGKPLKYHTESTVLAESQDTAYYLLHTILRTGNETASAPQASQQLFINKQSLKMEKNICTDSVSHHTFEASYTSFRNIAPGFFPFRSLILLKAGQETEIELDYNRVSRESTLSMPFQIPKNYEPLH